jgi:hypothetical protein
VVLALACLVIVLPALVALHRLHPRTEKDPRAGFVFAAPAVLLAPAAVWLLVEGSLLAALPVLTAMALFVCAAAIFVPTAETRFASFERDFWAHVHRDA